jgi:hypothetical protein
MDSSRVTGLALCTRLSESQPSASQQAFTFAFQCARSVIKARGHQSEVSAVLGVHEGHKRWLGKGPDVDFAATACRCTVNMPSSPLRKPNRRQTG